MSYGVKVNNSAGTAILEVSDFSPRLISITSVTVPSSGTTTVSVSSAATPTNSVAVLDNGAAAEVTNTGVVTITGSSGLSGTTNLKLLVCEL
jgi:hypothetical protein